MRLKAACVGDSNPAKRADRRWVPARRVYDKEGVGGMKERIEKEREGGPAAKSDLPAVP